MILTGNEIQRQLDKGNILLCPFNSSQLNPNSYNYRLGPFLKVFIKFNGNKSVFKKVRIPKKGYILKPGRMYLGHTEELIGSKKYAMSLIGRSSMGRLGLFLQVSANLGHTNSSHHWTLELVPSIPIRIYPNMIIGQVSFWTNRGEIKKYTGKFGKYNLPQEAMNRYDINR